MIRDFKRSADGAGYPVVSWVESRGLGRVAEVECRIKKRAGTGELLFVASSRWAGGRMERGGPWQRLTGFHWIAAESLHLSSWERKVRSHATGHSKVAAILLEDHGQVLLADFQNDHSIEINAAVATKAEMDHLAVELSKAFGEPEMTANSVYKKNDIRTREIFKWPFDDGRVKTYDEHVEIAKPNSVQEIYAGAVVAIIVAALVGLVWYLMAH